MSNINKKEYYVIPDASKVYKDSFVKGGWEMTANSESFVKALEKIQGQKVQGSTSIRESGYVFVQDSDGDTYEIHKMYIRDKEGFLKYKIDKIINRE